MDSDRSFDVPTDRHFDCDHHLWVQPNGDSTRVRVGIDSIGLESLGELAYIALQPVGTRCERGGSVGTLEAAKMTSNIVAPVSGTLARRNEEVLRDPLRVNRSPYEEGWLFEIDATDWEAESRRLVTGAAAAEWARREAERFEAESRAD
jgi:glycine cleavage system H protein